MLDLKEEKKFKKLHDMASRLKVPMFPEVFIILELHGRGNQYKDIFRGHSWTRNYYNFMYGATIDGCDPSGASTFGAGFQSLKSTAGNVVAGGPSYCCNRQSATAVLNDGFHNNTTTSTYGIQVGNGTAAFSVEDYALSSVIPSGNWPGMINYCAMELPVPTYDSTNKRWTLTASRIFNNNSGIDVTVSETGLVSEWIMAGTSSQWLLERSTLANPVKIIDGGSLTVKYLIVHDYSAID